MGASVEQLVERAKEGSLSAEDVDAVAARLKASPVGDDTYSLLYAISRTRATSHRDVVESFLDHSADPMFGARGPLGRPLGRPQSGLMSGKRLAAVEAGAAR